ncbi:CBS domain-containing protein [Streptomyces sp. enrichment culture]|uniref:CBS domain-containing protein n=1 Tax=Streptomyces sp. enrichment culture TaxID=1795815 RepID=UPI003F54CE83
MKTRIIGEVMTTGVVRVRPRTPFKHFVRLLDRHRIGGLPVVDGDDKVVGVVSATDLLRVRAPADRRPGALPRTGRLTSSRRSGCPHPRSPCTPSHRSRTPPA